MQQSCGVVEGRDAARYTYAMSCQEIQNTCFQKATREEHRVVSKLKTFTYIQPQLLKKDHTMPRALAFSCHLNFNLNTCRESTLGGGGVRAHFCLCIWVSLKAKRINSLRARLELVLDHAGRFKGGCQVSTK